MNQMKMNSPKKRNQRKATKHDAIVAQWAVVERSLEGLAFELWCVHARAMVSLVLFNRREGRNIDQETKDAWCSNVIRSGEISLFCDEAIVP